ncbi:MAG: Uma2 family endonuclease [Spirochaetaceae bacterium]
MAGSLSGAILNTMGRVEQAAWYSYKDYLSWPEGERTELIRGVPHTMSPAPRREHQRLVAEMTRQVANALRGAPCEVYPAPFDVKLTADQDDERPTVVQPDLSIVCDPGKLTEQGMTGPPDLVIEIVSPESGFHDRSRKFNLYQSAGVREYWIVDPDERVVEVYRLEGNESYRRIGAFGGTDTVTAGISDVIVVDLSELFPANRRA